MTPTNALRAGVSVLGRWVLVCSTLGCSALSCSATDARDEGGAGTGGAEHSGSGSSGAAGSAGTGAGAGGRVSTGGAGQTGGAGGRAGGAGAGGSLAAAGSGSAAGAGGRGAGSGCMHGDEKVPEGASVPAADGCNVCSCSAGMLACTERACASADCLVVRHLDRCCPEFEAVTRTALEADECLAEPSPAPDSMLAQRCFAKSPGPCSTVPCEQAEPPSRLAEPDGAGGCRFVDECQSADDCVIASDTRQCCACPSSMPAALLAGRPCLVPEGMTPTVTCPGCDLPVLCGQCVPPPAAPTCLIGDALNRCQ